MSYSLIQQQALGMDKSALCEWQQSGKCFLIHKEVRQPLLALQAEASKAGFDLQLASAYRDYSRQLSIWSAKASGQRQLLDAQGNPIEFSGLSDRDKLFAILRWSAIPGLSRHHWGTDFDIFDANQIALEDVQLVPQEVEQGGPCAAMHNWLSEIILQNKSFSFYRPYQYDTGGVAPEMWHLSYLPVAKMYHRCLREDILLSVSSENELPLLAELEANLTNIWSKYVTLDAADQPQWVEDLLG